MKFPTSHFLGSQRIDPWESLLHDSVRASALKQFHDGHWRDAQLNAVISVFDLIRERTGLDDDGDSLAMRTFGVNQQLR